MISEYLHYAWALSQPMKAVHVQFYVTNPSYIDPGTGSLIIQTVIGLLVGLLVGANMFWKRITGFFRGVFNRSSQRDGKREGS